MKNALNPCKCGSSEGGSELSSQIVYNGGAVDCIPGLVGANLSVVLKALGDYACDIEGRTQIITVNASSPSGGGEGDIWVRQQGSSITFYQNVSSSWVLRGQLFIGGGAPMHERPGVNFQTTSAELNGWYPAAVEGEVVWGEDGSDVWVFTKRGSNWSVRQEQIA